MSVPPREVGKVASIGNLTASGAVGSAAIDTDVRVITIAQTTAGLTFTLPNPADASAIVGLDVLNTGTVAFTMYGRSVLPSTLLRCAWSGSTWLPENASSAAVSVPAFTVANLPASGNIAGQLAFATNGRALNTAASLVNIAFETAGNGTGVLVSWNGTAWKVVATNSTVTA